MSFVRTQHQWVYPPQQVSRDRLKELVGALQEFKPGLATTSRVTKAWAISYGKITDEQGPDCWKVVDSHPLSGLEHVHVELLLTASEKESCELHVEFRPEHIALSVSDIQTGWGKSVFEDMRHLLDKIGLTSKGLKQRVRRAYALLVILQNPLMVVAAGVFALWVSEGGTAFLFASLGLFVAGAMPAATNAYRFFVPRRPAPLMVDGPMATRAFPWVEAGTVVAFLQGVLTLAKELSATLW